MLKKAIEYYGHPNALADALGLSRQAVWRWRRAGKMPELYWYKLAHITNGDLQPPAPGNDDEKGKLQG